MSGAMTGHVLVRARLRRDASVAAIAPLLLPTAPGAREGAAHRLIWSLFADAPDRARDFLWREMRPAEFLALARRLPADPHGLFELEFKTFAPVLHPGQRLAFSLRVNPVVSVPGPPGRRGRRRDIVTRAIAELPAQADADRRRMQRDAALHRAGASWLAAQGTRHGFTPEVGADRLRIDAEDWVRIPRDGAAPVTFLALTLEGVLRVDAPDRFLARLCAGFGAAKSFGCGLMLIRPARAGSGPA